MRLASVLLALAWTPAAFAAITIHPEIQGLVSVDTQGVHHENFVTQQLSVLSGISMVGGTPRPFEEQGVVEFDLRHHTQISEPIYFRFYLVGSSGPAHIAAYTSSADGFLHATDFDNFEIPLATLDIQDDFLYEPHNLEVTDEFNAAIGGWLGFNFSTDVGGRYWSPLDQTVVVQDGRDTAPLNGALTLGTELLGPVEFPIPEPASYLVWLAIGAIAIGRRLRGIWRSP